MDIYPCTFDWIRSINLENNEPIVLLDRLPQSGIGALYVRTREIGSKDQYYHAYFMLYDHDLELLESFETESPELQRVVQWLIDYMKQYPRDAYLFTVFE